MATDLLRYWASTDGPDVDLLDRMLAEGRRSPTAVIRIIADDEGYSKVMCPLGAVHANANSLVNLLGDLYAIASGPGFRPGAPLPHDEGMIVIDPDPSYCVARREGPHIDVSLESELQLRDQIEGVLSGQLVRLSLPAGFPDDEELTSVDEARRYPRAWLRLVSGALPDAVLLDAAVSIIRASDGTLHQLLSDLEARVMEHGRLAPEMEGRAPRMYFRRRVFSSPGVVFKPGHWGDAKRVLAVLEERLDHL